MHQRSLLTTWLRAAPSAAAGLLCSCLVTDQVHFSEPNVPSSLTRLTPSESFTRVPESPDPACSERTASSPNDWMFFSISISDPNVSDSLMWKIVVNNVPLDQGFIKQTAAAKRDDYSFCVKEASLNKACNKVEFLVSRDFDFAAGPSDIYATTEEGDLAIVEWRVLARASVQPEASPTACLSDITSRLP